MYLLRSFLAKIEQTCALAKQNKCKLEDLAVQDRHRLGATVSHGFHVNGKRQDFAGLVVARMERDRAACPTCASGGMRACKHIWGVLWADGEQSG